MSDIRIGRIIIKRCQTCRWAKPGQNNLIFCRQAWKFLSPDGCNDLYERGLGICKLNADDPDSMLPTVEEMKAAGF